MYSIKIRIAKTAKYLSVIFIPMNASFQNRNKKKTDNLKKEKQWLDIQEDDVLR